MKSYLFLLLLPLFAGAGVANAQNVPAPQNPALPVAPAAPAPRIVPLNAENVTSLRALTQRSDTDAVSMDVTEEQLQAQSGGLAALQAWVAAGGVVFLHTDVAQNFGYSTVPARLATPQLAGQLFGRAVAALPMGAHPLLWGGGTTGAAGGSAIAALTAAESEPGVQVIYYQMNEGDHLVVEHPAAVPLLRVTDFAAELEEPLYAAAIAPYGRGWAIFTPSFVNPRRADGALFLQNLMDWVAAAAAARRSAATVANTAGTATPASALTPAGVAPWYTLPAPFIESASSATADADGEFNAAAMLKALYGVFQTTANNPAPNAPAPSTAPAGDAAPAGDTAPQAATEVARVPVRREEISTLAVLLNSAATGTDGANEAAAEDDAPGNPAQRHAAALLYLLRARLELQRGQIDDAMTWVQAADVAAPDTAEVLLWKGVINAALAADFTQPAQSRAATLQLAIEFWDAALAAPDLTGTAASANRALGSMPASLVQAWLAAAGRRAPLLAVEPPLVNLLGTDATPVVLRHFPDDPSLRLALPAAELLPRASQAMGWNAGEEEILVFPTVEYYQAYRAAAGLGTPTITDPTGAGGDVVGNRILLVSQPSLPIILPPTTPGGPPRMVQFGTAVPIIISRLHAYVMMNALVQDGTPPPAWMQIGLIHLSNMSVVSDAGLGGIDTEVLRERAAAGALLSPAQFRAALLQTVPDDAATAQATSLLDYFYDQFGAGAVVETLQRLGAGETVDEALTATTDMNETEFFLAWRDAAFNVG